MEAGQQRLTTCGLMLLDICLPRDNEAKRSIRAYFRFRGNKTKKPWGLGEGLCCGGTH